MLRPSVTLFAAAAHALAPTVLASLRVASAAGCSMSSMSRGRSREERTAVVRKLDAEAHKAHAEAEEAQAMRLKTEAEAEATRRKMLADEKAAEVAQRKAEAEAEAMRRKAEVEAQAMRVKTEAEAEATRRKMLADEKAAEVAQRKAEVEAKAAEAALEMSRDPWRYFRQVAISPFTWLIASAAVLLAADWVVHDSKTYLTWRVKRALRDGRLVRADSELVLLAPIAEPVDATMKANVSGYPVALYGPSGCGKSTYMEKVAWDNVHSDPILPTALVKFRLQQENPAQKAPDSAAESSPPQPETVAERVTGHVCEQVGIPERSSWVSSVHSVTVSMLPLGGQVDLRGTKLSRVSFALSILFRAADELYRETGQKPMLIFDEAHDLVRSRTLRMAGGEGVFMQLGTAAVQYGVESHSVRFVAVGSSALFVVHWENTTPLAGPRIMRLELPDPPREQLMRMLTTPVPGGNACTPQDAARLLDACGRRVRLLQDAVPAAKAAPVRIDNIILRQRCMAESSIDQLFTQVGVGVRPKLVKLLDDVLRADMDAKADRPKCSAAPFDMQVHTMPAAALRVLYVNAANDLFFQSDVVRTVWKERRAKHGRRHSWMD